MMGVPAPLGTTQPYAGLGVSPLGTPFALSPDALMTYLQSRLQGIDQNIDNIFQRTQKDADVQKALNDISSVVNGVKTGGKKGGARWPSAKEQQEIQSDIDAIKAEDPQMGADLENKLHQKGQILGPKHDVKASDAADSSGKLIDDETKNLESNQQMDMISLQSMMSDRQTAVQLATNMISALGNTARSIASNIGK